MFMFNYGSTFGEQNHETSRIIAAQQHRIRFSDGVESRTFIFPLSGKQHQLHTLKGVLWLKFKIQRHIYKRKTWYFHKIAQEYHVFTSLFSCYTVKVKVLVFCPWYAFPAVSNLATFVCLASFSLDSLSWDVGTIITLKRECFLVLTYNIWFNYIVFTSKLKTITLKLENYDVKTWYYQGISWKVSRRRSEPKCRSNGLPSYHAH